MATNLWVRIGEIDLGLSNIHLSHISGLEDCNAAMDALTTQRRRKEAWTSEAEVGWSGVGVRFLGPPAS